MEKKYNFVYTERCISKDDEVLYEHQIEFEGTEEVYDKMFLSWGSLAINSKRFNISVNTIDNGSEMFLRYEDYNFIIEKVFVMEY